MTKPNNRSRSPLKRNLGSFLSFEFELRYHPGTWISFQGIMVKKYPKTGCATFFDIHNKHLCVFSPKGNYRKLRKVGT